MGIKQAVVQILNQGHENALESIRKNHIITEKEALPLLMNELSENMTQIESKLDEIVTKKEFKEQQELHFGIVDQRFMIIDERFKSIDERFRSIDERFKSIEKRLDNLENRFEFGFKVMIGGFSFLSILMTVLKFIP